MPKYGQHSCTHTYAYHIFTLVDDWFMAKQFCYWKLQLQRALSDYVNLIKYYYWDQVHKTQKQFSHFNTSQINMCK